MVALTKNNGEKIEYKLNNAIYEAKENTFIIEMPMIFCSNKEDAKFIQEKINTYVSKLSKELSTNK